MESISGVIAKEKVFDSPTFKESHTNPFNSFAGLATEEIYPVNIIEPLCHQLFYNTIRVKRLYRSNPSRLSDTRQSGVFKNKKTAMAA